MLGQTVLSNIVRRVCVSVTSEWAQLVAHNKNNNNK